MKYPTIEQVKEADRVQLGTWYRFLPSPGWDHVGCEDFPDALQREAGVMDMICERLEIMGGWTPELSKEVNLFMKE